MKHKIFITLTTLLIAKFTYAQTDIIFKNGLEAFFKLNDTGITWSGEYPSVNNSDCTSSTITAAQDCNQGRDGNVLTNSDVDGHAGFSFTKLDINGDQLVVTATNWTCIKDNVTGLIWEIKTDTAGDHFKGNTYRWGGLTAVGRDHPNREGTYYDDWTPLVEASNNESFCGITNWRIPTVAELSTIVDKGVNAPSIDTNFFPHSDSNVLWTSSPLTILNTHSWFVSFENGKDNIAQRNTFYPVRLVFSNGQ